MPRCEAGAAECEFAVFTDAEAVFVVPEVFRLRVFRRQYGLGLEIVGCEICEGFLGIPFTPRYALTPAAWAEDGLWEGLEALLALELDITLDCRLDNRDLE